MWPPPPASRPPALGEPGLTAIHVAAAAYDEADALDFTLGTAARWRITRAAAHLRQAREAGAVYGLTTGVGALRQVDLAEHASTEPQLLRLWRSHAGGLGPELDEPTARATMLVRLHQIARGHSGIDLKVAEALATALREGAVPRLQSYGGLGTGDLTVLAQLGLSLVGELPWRRGNPEPLVADDANGLPFISSNAATLALASLAVVSIARSVRTMEQVAGLSWHALGGNAEAYDARVHDDKGDAEAAGVAARMREHIGERPLAPRRIQDPFCLRAIPQAHSALEAALTALDAVISAELDAGAENPFVVDDDDELAPGTVLHHGQFLTQRLATALDTLRVAVHPALSLSSSRTSALMLPDLTELPPFLLDGPAGSSGLMIVEYVASDLVARSHHLAGPASSARAVVSLGLEEHASFSTHAAWLCRDLATITAELVACELVTAVRALHQAPERLAAVPRTPWVERVFDELPYVAADHVVGPELGRARELVELGLDAWAV